MIYYLITYILRYIYFNIFKQTILGLTSSISAGITALGNLPSLPHLHEQLKYHWFFNNNVRSVIIIYRFNKSSIEFYIHKYIYILFRLFPR